MQSEYPVYCIFLFLPLNTILRQETEAHHALDLPSRHAPKNMSFNQSYPLIMMNSLTKQNAAAGFDTVGIFLDFPGRHCSGRKGVKCQTIMEQFQLIRLVIECYRIVCKSLTISQYLLDACQQL